MPFAEGQYPSAMPTILPLAKVRSLSIFLILPLFIYLPNHITEGAISEIPSQAKHWRDYILRYPLRKRVPYSIN